MIKHILADGTEVESMEGRMVPLTEKTQAAYRLLADFAIKNHLNEKEAQHGSRA